MSFRNIFTHTTFFIRLFIFPPFSILPSFGNSFYMPAMLSSGHRPLMTAITVRKLPEPALWKVLPIIKFQGTKMAERNGSAFAPTGTTGQFNGSALFSTGLFTY